MAAPTRADGVLLSSAPRGVNLPGLLLGVIWIGCLVVGGYLYLNTPSTTTPTTTDISQLSQSITSAIEVIRQRIWAYALLGFGLLGLMIQLGAESVLWHLNRR